MNLMKYTILYFQFLEEFYYQFHHRCLISLHFNKQFIKCRLHLTLVAVCIVLLFSQLPQTSILAQKSHYSLQQTQSFNKLAWTKLHNFLPLCLTWKLLICSGIQLHHLGGCTTFMASIILKNCVVIYSKCKNLHRQISYLLGLLTQTRIWQCLMGECYITIFSIQFVPTFPSNPNGFLYSLLCDNVAHQNASEYIKML